MEDVSQKIENWKETWKFMSSGQSENDLRYIKKSSTLSRELHQRMESLLREGSR